jgi:hypothetical protein
MIPLGMSPPSPASVLSLRRRRARPWASPGSCTSQARPLGGPRGSDGREGLARLV